MQSTNKRKSTPCVVCGKRFMNLKSMEQHLKSGVHDHLFTEVVKRLTHSEEK